MTELYETILKLQRQIDELKEELKKAKGGTVIHNHYHYPYYGYWYYPTGPQWTLSSKPNSIQYLTSSTTSYQDSTDQKRPWAGSNWQNLTGKLESNTKG